MINRFRIIDLYGTRTYDIRIDDNTIILVGENGMGKTTVLKLLFATISGSTRYLPTYRFKEILITIDNIDYQLQYEDTIKMNKIPLRIIKDIPPSARNEIMELVKVNNADNVIDIDDLRNACSIIGFPFQRITDILNHDYNYKTNDGNTAIDTISSIKKQLNSQVLYLPTYRRIEEDLPGILRGRWSMSNRRAVKQNVESDYIELVEFGMQDVKEKIAMKQEELSRFSEMSFKNLTYMNLGDVVDRKYEVQSESLNITNEDIKKFELCSSRINETVLSKEQYHKIIHTVLNINCYCWAIVSKT